MKSSELVSGAYLLMMDLNEHAGVTYPLKTLARRLALLTIKERGRVTSLWNKLNKLQVSAMDIADEIDDIITTRSIKAKDKWP